MFNLMKAGAGRKPGRRRAFYLFGLMLSLFLCAAFWAVAHYQFGFYLDREHPKGSRIYRVNSYEQFIKKKTGEAMVKVASCGEYGGKISGGKNHSFPKLNDGKIVL